MTTATILVSRRLVPRPRGGVNRFWNVLFAWFHRRRQASDTRRQLLSIHPRLLRDIGLDGDEALLAARARFFAIQHGLPPNSLCLHTPTKGRTYGCQ